MKVPLILLSAFVSGDALVIDRTTKLEINGSTQRMRLCAERAGLAPVLVVQAGPGLPLLHEVAKFRHRLHLETDCTVAYWEQRGCGNASQQDARSVSLRQQVEDLRAVLTWLWRDSQQAVTVLGISLGATIALQAVAQEADKVKSVIAVSPDADTAASDASAESFLREKIAGAEGGALGEKSKKLGPPPYTDPAVFQLRARLLTDAGSIERGKKFTGLLRETLWAMLRAYGVLGTAKALGNLNTIQRVMLPEIVSLNLFAEPPQLAVPVHFVFGEQDALTPASIFTRLPSAISAPAKTVMLVPDAGHMVHFDQPEVVRAIVLKAVNGG